MAREDLHFRLRIPEELKIRVQTAAESNHRSMTAEIVATLEDKYPAPDSIENLSSLLQVLTESVQSMPEGEEKIRVAKLASGSLSNILSEMERKLSPPDNPDKDTLHLIDQVNAEITKMPAGSQKQALRSQMRRLENETDDLYQERIADLWEDFQKKHPTATTPDHSTAQQTKPQPTGARDIQTGEDASSKRTVETKSGRKLKTRKRNVQL